MTRDQLEHAIRAVCEVTKDSEIWIFGSQAILGEFPNAPKELRTSIEVDVQPKNRVDKVEVIDGSLGELSPFYYAHGFYVHGLPIEETATLPQGWENRAKPVFDKISTTVILVGVLNAMILQQASLQLSDKKTETSCVYS